MHRERTGEGQHIDLGMYQLGVVVMPEAVLHLQAHGEELSRRGNEDLVAFASGLVPAAGDDRWLAVSIPSAEAFTRAMRVAPGADPMAVVAAWARDRDAAAAAAELQAAGIPAGPVLDARDLLTSEHLRARGFYEEVDVGPGCGVRPVIGRPYRLEGAHVRGPAPAFGEANDDVLRGLLGIDEPRLAELRRLGVVADAPTGVPTSLAPIDLAVLLASRSITRVDEDYREVLASPVS